MTSRQTKWHQIACKAAIGLAHIELARWTGAMRRLFGLIVGIAAIAAISFIISPFDATVRGDIGIRAFQETFSAAAVGVAVGLAAVVIDGGSAVLVALGLWANPTWSERLDRWTTRVLYPTRSRKEAGQESPSTGAASDLSLALAVGPGAVLLKYPAAAPQRWLRIGLKYTLFNTFIFGTIGWMAAGGANWMADIGFGWLREGMIRWVPEPLVWTGLFVVTVLVPFLRGEWLDRQAEIDPSNQPATETEILPTLELPVFTPDNPLTATSYKGVRSQLHETEQPLWKERRFLIPVGLLTLLVVGSSFFLTEQDPDGEVRGTTLEFGRQVGEPQQLE